MVFLWFFHGPVAPRPWAPPTPAAASAASRHGAPGSARGPRGGHRPLRATGLLDSAEGDFFGGWEVFHGKIYGESMGKWGEYRCFISLKCQDGF